MAVAESNCGLVFPAINKTAITQSSRAARQDPARKEILNRDSFCNIFKSVKALYCVLNCIKVK